MNRTLESVLRFVNLTASGLLAGSLGFGESALTPGWEKEVSKRRTASLPMRKYAAYFNAIGPVALGTSVALAIGASGPQRPKRFLDVVSALGQAGVLASTTLLTVPLNEKLEHQAPVDYPSANTQSLAKNWRMAHDIRTALGVTSFLCSVASTTLRR